MIDLEKKTAKEKLIEWYVTLDPSKRKQVTLIGGGAAMFVVAAILIVSTSDDSSKNREKWSTRCSTGKVHGMYPSMPWREKSKS